MTEVRRQSGACGLTGTRVRKRTGESAATALRQVIERVKRLRPRKGKGKSVPYRDIESEKATAKRLLLANTPNYREDSREPQQCDLSFAEIGQQAGGISGSTVAVVAARLNIIPPPKKGRPPGKGKALGQRSPYRKDATRLRGLGMSLRAIAAEISNKYGITISAEAIRQLIATDGKSKNK